MRLLFCVALLVLMVTPALAQDQPTPEPSVVAEPTPEPSVVAEPSPAASLAATEPFTGTVELGPVSHGSLYLTNTILLFGFSALVSLQLIGLFVLGRR